MSAGAGTGAGSTDEMTADAPRSGRRSRVPTSLIYATLGVVALSLRLWGIGFGAGLPRARPDEEVYLGSALRMFDGNLDAGLLRYGITEGFCLLLHGVLRLQAALLTWRHGVEVNLGCLFALQPTAVLLTGRYLSALFGVATLVPCAFVARHLVTPARADIAGTIAALLLAVNYLHGRDSHFGVPDAALTFALAAALAAAVGFVEDGRTQDALLAGVFTGLAVALKWTGLFMIPVLAIVLAIAVLRFRHNRPRRRVAVATTSLLLAVVTFLALEPHVLNELGETVKGLLSHSSRYGQVSLGDLQDPSVDLGRGFGFHTRVTLPIACGWFGFAMAGIGLVLAFRRRPFAAAAGAIFVVFLFVVAVGPTRFLFVRYCMPILPVLAAFAAAGLVEGVEALRYRLPRRRVGAVVLVAGAAAAALPPAVRLVEVDVRLARPDTRTLASEWVRAHAGSDETVMPLVGYSSIYAIPIEGSTACATALPATLRSTVARLPPIVTPGWHRWSPAVARGRVGWGAVGECALADYWNMPGVTPATSDYVAYGQPLLSCGKPSVIRGLTPPDPACFAEVARFSPGRPSCDAVYDLFDQFYLPYDGFTGVDRPGPEIVIYRNGCPRTRR